MVRFVIFFDQKPTYNTPQRIMLGVDKTFRPENIFIEGSREIRGYYIYLADRRIYSSKEVGKFLSFFSIFLLIYLYSDWQVCVVRCVFGFSLLYSDWQLCVLRCVVGFNLSQWVSLLFENVDLCDSHAMFMCVIVCMDGIEFCLYGMLLNFVIALNLIKNVIGLTMCSLQEDSNVTSSMNSLYFNIMQNFQHPFPDEFEVQVCNTFISYFL